MGEVPATHIRIKRKLVIDGDTTEYKYEDMPYHFLAPSDTISIPFRFRANNRGNSGVKRTMEFSVLVEFKGIVDFPDVDRYEYKISSTVIGDQFPPKGSGIFRRTIKR